MSNFTLFTATESSSPALPVVCDCVLQLPCLRWHQCSGSCAAGLKINLTTEKKRVFIAEAAPWTDKLCADTERGYNEWLKDKAKGGTTSFSDRPQGFK